MFLRSAALVPIFLIASLWIGGKRAYATSEGISSFSNLTNTVTLIAGGDFIPHDKVVKSVKLHPLLLFEALKPKLSDADLLLLNLETPLAIKDYNAKKSFVFNGPKEFIEELKFGGWNIINTANNHAYDQAQRGVQETFERLSKEGFVVLGTAATQADAVSGIRLEKNGIKFAFFSMAETFNSSPAKRNPKKTWVAGLKDFKLILQEITKARKEVKYVVLSVHWGEEYETSARSRQKKMAKEFFKAGVDLILGSHPHVVQQVEAFMMTDAVNTKQAKPRFVAYSLGNLISNQGALYARNHSAKDLKEPIDVGNPREAILLKVQFSDKQMNLPEIIPIWNKNENRPKALVAAMPMSAVDSKDKVQSKNKDKLAANLVSLFSLRKKHLQSVLKLNLSGLD